MHSQPRRAGAASRILASCAILASAFAVPAAAQTPIVSLDTLIATQGSITAGDVTFGNFAKPKLLPRQVGAFLGEFNDVGVVATNNADGTVTLSLVGIDPTTGLARPWVVGGATGGGELLRLLSYTVTVNNPARRLHSVADAYGPATFVAGGSGSAPFNFLYGVEPTLLAFGPGPWVDGLREDFWPGPGDFTPFQTLLPGGNLPTYTMENEFGFLKGHLGIPADGTMDSMNMTFTLVPTGTAVPPVTADLVQPGDVLTLTGMWASPNAFVIEPTAGMLQLVLNNFAQDGGAVVTLGSDNPSAFPLPQTLTIAQGNYISPPIYLGPTHVDFPTTVTLTASLGSRTQTQNFVANPTTPLAITGVYGGVTLCGFTPCAVNTQFRVGVQINQTNIAAQTIALTSSRPDICPSQNMSLPALTQPSLVPVQVITCKPVAVDTPITYTATLNGVSTSMTATLWRTVDGVLISKAELVVKNLSLKVDATNQVPGDTLTLYNAATGQLIGNMTMTGTVGIGGKYQFQGTISAPVQTLLLKSALNGSTTFTVSQK